MAIGLRCNTCAHVFLNALPGNPYQCPACGESRQFRVAGAYPLTDRAHNIITEETLGRLKALGVLPEAARTLANPPEIDALFEPRHPSL